MSEAFDRLFEQYHQKVYTFFTRHRFPPEEARELAQQTWLRVFDSMGAYRGGDLAFLMTVASSVWKNELRRRSALKRGDRPSSLDDPGDPIAERVERPLFGDPPKSPEAAALWQERVAAYRREVRALPPRMRRALALRVHGLSYREIGVALRASDDAVKKLLYQARRRLQESVGGSDDG